MVAQESYGKYYKTKCCCRQKNNFWEKEKRELPRTNIYSIKREIRQQLLAQSPYKPAPIMGTQQHTWMKLQGDTQETILDLKQIRSFAETYIILSR